MMKKIPLAVVFLFSICSFAFSQDATPLATGSVIGHIRDHNTKEDIIGAAVQVVGTKLGTTTDVSGKFTLQNLSIGTYQLKITAIGYEPFIKTDVIINAAKPVVLLIELAERAVTREEVVVTADYFQKSNDAVVSQQSLSYEEIRRSAGGFEDVVRAVSTLPGVAQADNGRNDLLVRGGAPSENLFLIDNIESPNINHFGTQGAGGGPLSFVNLDFVRDVSFATGGYGVKYGDKLSSVLTIDLRDGRDDRFGGKATISASQFGLNLEGPVTASKDGTFLFSARRSYLDLIFKAAGFSFVPEYWDFLGKADYNLGKGNTLSLLAIAAIDRTRLFNDTPKKQYDNSRLLSNSQDQLVAGITWRSVFKGGFSNLTFGRTLVDYKFKQSDSTQTPFFVSNSTEDEFSLRGDVTYIFSRKTEVTFGGQAKRIRFKSQTLLPPFVSSFGDTLAVNSLANENFYKGALYAQVSQQFFNSLKINLGGRLDYFSPIQTKFYVSPRLSATLPLDEKLNLNVSAGRYYQNPSYIWLVSNAINLNLKAIQTNQAVIGIDRSVRSDLKISVETYYKQYKDYPASLTRRYLVLANTGAGFGGSEDGFSSFGFEPLVSAGTGEAYGVEVLLQKKLSELPFYGVLSLSVNQSKFAALDGITRPSNYDQRVIFNVSGGYKFSELWEASSKFRFATGRPYTPLSPVDGSQQVSQYNAVRLGASHSLDVRVDKRWNLTSLNLITYIDIQNIYNRKNPNVGNWNAQTRQIENQTSGIGILPSIGISAEF